MSHFVCCSLSGLGEGGRYFDECFEESGQDRESTDLSWFRNRRLAGLGTIRGCLFIVFSNTLSHQRASDGFERSSLGLVRCQVEQGPERINLILKSFCCWNAHEWIETVREVRFRTSYYVCVGKHIDKNLRQMRYTHQQEFTFHEDTCWTQLYGIFKL